MVSFCPAAARIASAVRRGIMAVNRLNSISFFARSKAEHGVAVEHRVGGAYR